MQNINVLEFEGLAPSVFCALYFADLGANVTIVARSQPLPFNIPIQQNISNRNKKCICLDLKSKRDLAIIKQLIKKTDIIVDPFRPGVLQKLGLGPKDLQQLNPRVILLRVSGYGQYGKQSLRPGHDMNYIGVAGILSKFGQQQKPQFPNNYVADFASASLGITGTLIALIERQRTGKGKIVDCSLADCSRYLALPIVEYRQESIIKMYKSKDEELVGIFSNQKEVDQFEKSNNPKHIQKIPSMKDINNANTPYDLKKLGIIYEQNNTMGYSINSPFTTKLLPNRRPQRGEHTQQILKQLKPKL